jgi:IS1 family transposase
LDGDVEIDESLFGRKVKYNPTTTRIWIFAMVQRSINQIVMFPVDNRDVPTLMPLIEKHVAPAAGYLQTVGLPTYTSVN